MSLRTFFRVFQKATGQSPNKYLKRVRLNHAAEKLRSTDETITEVAFACGFNNSNFFSREFNRDYGMSPSTYRRIWQG
jgi:transcriptional regulator GlxA family with amidase domain